VPLSSTGGVVHTTRFLVSEGDPIEKIFPFSVEEQLTLTTAITDHWKLYFRSAFTIGLRAGEQIGLKPRDIDKKASSCPPCHDFG
jgi:integrase